VKWCTARLKECGSASKIDLAVPRCGIVSPSSRCAAVVTDASSRSDATGHQRSQVIAERRCRRIFEEARQGRPMLPRTARASSLADDRLPSPQIRIFRHLEISRLIFGTIHDSQGNGTILDEPTLIEGPTISALKRDASPDLHPRSRTRMPRSMPDRLRTAAVRSSTE
jgi:hypothetical protein